MQRAGSSNDVVAPDSDSENNSEPSWWIPSDEEDDQGEDNPEEPPSVMAAFDSLPPVPTAPESHGTTQPAKKTPKQSREVDRPHHQFTVGSCAARQALKEILWKYRVHIQQPLRKGYRAKLMGETHSDPFCQGAYEGAWL